VINHFKKTINGRQRKKVLALYNSNKHHTALQKPSINSNFSSSPLTLTHQPTLHLHGKGEGELAMVAAFVSAKHGMCTESMKIITPGSQEGKDRYWNSEDVLNQARNHLHHGLQKHPNDDFVLIYDNSTSHNCDCKNALKVSKLNKFPGHCRKDKVRVIFHLTNLYI
jgi:hypothetical protein